ncbi:hypothetical protein ACIBCT_35680 [Streptosporangium sp. NPDC050855]|uniref:hypothetical protein n=1 Tax=Streptosporangium sp. NPDC050855 TaxID=3366194 RepID=UPI0037A6A225
MDDALNLSDYAEAQRAARIAAEDRAVVTEARLRTAQARIRELETLVLLYRPADAAPQPEASFRPAGGSYFSPAGQYGES